MIRFKTLLKETQGLTPKAVYAKVEAFIGKYPEYKDALRLMYEPNIKFYIKITTEELYESYHMCNAKALEPTDSVEDMVALLMKLHTRELKGQKAKDTVWDYILNENFYIIYWLYGRMDNGFGVSSARKLGIISAHNPQKGILVKDIDSLPYPLIADVKYNGIRCTVYNNELTGCECKLLRGQVKSIPKLQALIEKALPKGWCYDGELIYGLGITEEDRLMVSRLMNQKGSIDLIGGYKFVIYDLVPIDNFTTGRRYTKPFFERRVQLIEFVDKAKELDEWSIIQVAQSFRVENSIVLNTLMRHIKDHNGEGVMLKALHSTYDFKKNKQWYKLKTYKEASLRIKAYRVHTRNDSWIGSLLCEGVVDNKPVKVWVGSGLNDADRDINLFNNTYLGGLVEVVFMDIVQDEVTKAYSLTNPRFNKPSTNTLLRDIIRHDALSINF